MHKRKLNFIFFTVLTFVLSRASFSQNYAFTSEESKAMSSTGARSAQAGFAEENFRRGVQSYYRGSFNDAIVEFEKALSYLPSENIIMEWLGKSYYKTGLEGAALNYWSGAARSGYGGLLLQNKIEIVRDRRISNNAYDGPIKYTEAGTYPGGSGEEMIFSKPVSILPNPDGSMWIVAYGSNELLKMDINGFVFERRNGPFEGFDRPMDIIKTADGKILVTEFAGDRISLFDRNGRFEKSFGSKGIGVGNVIGPQYAAEDSFGNIYVTDFGNGRVDVFDKDGKGLFFFGEFKAPTGIAVESSSVFVADAVTGAVYKYDTAGNYLGILCPERTFAHPEAMKLWGKYLIVCDKNKIYSVDVDSGSAFENVSTGNAPSRLTCAVPDVNGNLLATDYETNEIYVMAKLSELVGGFFVQIERVSAEKFPTVVLDVKVENRRRQSVVGLKENNFTVTENKNAVADFKFLGASYANTVADITLLIDRSEESVLHSQAVETAVREVASAMNGKGTLRIVSCSSIPVLEYEGSPSGAEKFSVQSLKNTVSPTCALDTAIRLASNPLINGEKKRGIIYIGTGKLTADAFSKYTVSDLTSYLNNNSISFSGILVQNDSPAKELSYVFDNTNGVQYYVYRSRGLKDIVQEIIDIPSGNYMISYTSAQTTAFGQKYIPVEVGVHLMNRSGRDETGFFAPLQ